MTELSDELLVAYVDGQLDRPQAATLARLLGEDDELARRVRRLQQTQARLMEHFAAMQRDMACGPLEDYLGHGEGRSAAMTDALGQGVRWGAIAALLFLGAAAGFGASSYLGAPAQADRPLKDATRIPPAPDAGALASTGPRGGVTGSASTTIGLIDELAGVHVQLMRESPAGHEGPANRDLAPFQLASLVGRPLSVPDFSRQGLTLTRTQMLTFRGMRFMQLVYAGKSEASATLYVMAGASSGGAEPLSFGSSGDVRAAGWSADGVRCVIAGKMPPDALRALAAIAQSQMGKRA